MLKLEEIRIFLDQDATSTKKHFARMGQRYYDGDHDILNYRVFYIDAEGKLQEDKYRSNVKIAHPFFKIIADQEAQYILSVDGGIFKSDIPELQAELDEYFNSNDVYMSELYDAIVGTIVKGHDFMYAYRNEEGKTSFQCADSLGVVEVDRRFASDKQEHILFTYLDKPDITGRRIRRIQDWDNKTVSFYIQDGEGKIKKDPDAKVNPRPHIEYTLPRDEHIYYDDYGRIPFIRLDNDKRQQSGLVFIKDQIDSYDLMNCGLVNNIQDTSEALYVVKGFQGDNLDELMMNIKAKKHIGVDDEGGVEIKTVDIPYEARKIKMEIDERNIFRFGFGVNTEALKDTSATVSVAIKSAYANLDLKCNGFNNGLRKFLRKQLDIVLAEINAENGTAYRQTDVYFNLERQIITNAQEVAQIKLIEAQEQQTRVATILNTAAKFGDELTMQNLCEAFDMDYDELKDKFPQPEDDIALVQGELDEMPVE